MPSANSGNRKTLLVLGASRYQMDAIRAARRIGYRVVTTDNVPANPGHALADAHYAVDTTDREAALEIAVRERINGVIAPCTDVAVPTAAHIAERLDLPGPPLKSAEIVCDKLAFREFLRVHAFPVPKAVEVRQDALPDNGLFERRPWIVKPDRSSGSKGVFIVRTAAELRSFLPETLSFSPGRRAILEEFIAGHQGTCEGVLVGGRIALACVMDRQTVEAPHTATCGHRVPSNLPASQQAALLAQLEKVWTRLDVRDGPFDCDFVATHDRVCLLELSPRLGGNSIASLLRQATGFDLVEYAVRQACGDPFDLPHALHPRPTALVLFGVLQKGRLRYNASELESLQGEGWVNSLSLDYRSGDSVLPFTNGRHRVGEAIVSGADRLDVDARVVQLKARLDLKAE